MKRPLLEEHLGKSLASLPVKDHFKKLEKHSTSLLGEAPKGIFRYPSTGHLYLFKWPKERADGFTHGFREILTEVILTRLAGRLTKSAEVGMARYRGETVFVTKIFTRRSERLVHGVEIFKGLYDDKGIDEIQEKREAQRIFYTVQHISSALKEYLGDRWDQEIEDSFYRMLLVDAWLGNQDRHAENWGLIEYVSPEGDKRPPRFAPLFDTARGLLWNTHYVGLLEHLTNNIKFDGYINESRPLISLDGNSDVNHFHLAQHVRNEDPRLYRRFIADLERVDIDREIGVFGKYLTPAREHGIKAVLKRRKVELVKLA